MINLQHVLVLKLSNGRNQPLNANDTIPYSGFVATVDQLVSTSISSVSGRNYVNIQVLKLRIEHISSFRHRLWTSANYYVAINCLGWWFQRSHPCRSFRAQTFQDEFIHVMVVQNKAQCLTPARTFLKRNVNQPKRGFAEAPFLSLFGLVLFLNPHIQF